MYQGASYFQLVEDDLNAKLTALSKQVKALALTKATTNLSKENSTMCAFCDIIGHCIDVCPIVAGVKKVHGQVNAVN